MNEHFSTSVAWICLTVVVCMCIYTCSGGLRADECPRLLGDVNCDNQVDVHDYLALDAFLNGEDPEPFDVEAGDMDQDGVVGATDCLLLAQEVGGLVR
jgi:hypothetical protein